MNLHSKYRILRIASLLVILLLLSFRLAHAAYLLIPMDQTQTNHLKAYGIAYWVLQQKGTGEWLLNYRGGSFLFPFSDELQTECLLREVRTETIADATRIKILQDIARPEVNMDVIKLEKAPRVAVYAPPDKQPWDDAVMLALTYAEIPYDQIYDAEIMDGALKNYDWLHLHHEDFTGQYGKFYKAYGHMEWIKSRSPKMKPLHIDTAFKKYLR
ncbi:MAG: hypothetical protein J7L89_04380 [Bacteroidales bacterium]|nr:hypothetical protein [Bacteroidales bacterium]